MPTQFTQGRNRKRKPRRPKPVNFGARRTLRFGEDEEAAVDAMRHALAKVRAVDVEKVSFSEALRVLLTENVKAAQALAGRPDAWGSAGVIDLPEDAWTALTQCSNRLSHSQGSLYTILRKLNFEETVERDEVVDAFEAVQQSKAAVERMERMLAEFVDAASAAAVAEARRAA